MKKTICCRCGKRRRYKEKSYCLECLRAMSSFYKARRESEIQPDGHSAPVFDGEPWKPDHPGPWTDADMAEYNRRHPFLRSYVAGMVGLIGSLKQHQERCRETR